MCCLIDLLIFMIFENKTKTTPFYFSFYQGSRFTEAMRRFALVPSQNAQLKHIKYSGRALKNT